MLEKISRERILGRIYIEEQVSINRLEVLFAKLSTKYKLDNEKIVDIIKKRQQYLSIPARIFNSKLSPLETVVLYLFTKFKANITQISKLLLRDHTTIWTTLDNARKKKFKQFEVGEDTLIPIKIFSQRKLSILESLCTYLKDEHALTYHEIAKILGKNDRTVWTVINRTKLKMLDK